MVTAAAKLLVIAWLPGAVMYRLPLADRDKRAALPAEERLFWQVLLSVATSLSLALLLGILHRYTFGRLLAADAIVAAALAVGARFQLRLRGVRPTSSALLVAIIVALGVWRFSPPAEYIIGGKDPGTYLNEGIVLAQRGTLVYDDPLVAAVPGPTRALFFATHEEAGHYGTRFMGFPILDPQAGSVVGQFPHLFPASIAIAYGIDGLTGARRAVGAWAILGLVAVYLAGARLIGRAAAAAAVMLLGLHVIEVWFGRYPNAEVVMQALLFGALLANARAHVDGDRFFAPVAAVLLVLMLFLRIDAVLGIAAVIAANLLAMVRGQPLRWSFAVILAAGGALAVLYLLGPLRPYAYLPTQFIVNLKTWQQWLLAAAAVAFAGVLSIARRHPAAGQAITSRIPGIITAVLAGLTVYALFFRTPAGKLALENAYALRMYAAFYVTVPAVIAALIGYALVARRGFWRDPALMLTVAFFCVFFFFKIRIVPEHFWAARRFLPVILPGTLLFACAAAAWGLRQSGWRRWVSGAIGAAFIALLANRYVTAAQPVMHHVEYAGVIPELEKLAAAIPDGELLLVESRDAGSDAHVFALPLAYIYARNVLVLGSARPDPTAFAGFLPWARGRFSRVYFLGSGGTELLSRAWSARSISSQRFQVPEYESAWNAYPRSVRMKEFDFGLYELLPAAATAEDGFDLDVGIGDDLHVVRFHAKEVVDGRSMRWSQRQSFVAVRGIPPTAREVVIVMSSGGRPPAAPPADVTVYLDERLLGTAPVTDGFHPYSFAIPADVVAADLTRSAPARLRLVTTTWNPHATIGSGDTRDLGVMVDRVQVR
jgi:hypothetical protein